MFLTALFIAVFIGIGFVLYALYAFANEKEGNDSSSYLELDNTIKAIDSSVQEADDAMEQLNKMAKSIFEEIDGKYQELLFLYTLIDEKKKDIAEAFRVTSSNRVKTDLVADEYSSVMSEKNMAKNPKLDKINDLSQNGLSITEIAKNLNMGQGEVKLIMELGKAR